MVGVSAAEGEGRDRGVSVGPVLEMAADRTWGEAGAGHRDCGGLVLSG